MLLLLLLIMLIQVVAVIIIAGFTSNRLGLCFSSRNSAHSRNANLLKIIARFIAVVIAVIVVDIIAKNIVVSVEIMIAVVIAATVSSFGIFKEPWAFRLWDLIVDDLLLISSFGVAASRCKIGKTIGRRLTINDERIVGAVVAERRGGGSASSEKWTVFVVT